MTSHKRDAAEAGNAYMCYIADVTAAPADGGKPTLHTMEDIEKEIGDKLSLYGHSVTRGSGKTKVTITPSAAPVVYVPSRQTSPEQFGHKTLGSWLPAQESMNGTTLKTDGCVRPVFEVIVAGGSAGNAPQQQQPTKVIKPMNIAGRNRMHMFTSKKIDIPANGWFAMN